MKRKIFLSLATLLALGALAGCANQGANSTMSSDDQAKFSQHSAPPPGFSTPPAAATAKTKK